ncbi:MAG: substrate-binding domain-containing protein [Phycisphaerae bacterium]
MRGIASYAHDHGPWHVYTAPEGSENSMFFAPGYRWDGVIARVTDQAMARWIMKLGVPVVNISAVVLGSGEGVELPRVKVDEGALTRIAVRHLRAAGFRQFAYCGSFESMEERGPAFMQTLRQQELGCAVYRSSRGLTGHTPWQRRQKDLIRWVRRLPKPVGILAWNSDIACQLVEACNLAQIAVPGEAAILAGDDDQMKNELCSPTVSALDQPTERIGYEAATLLDRLMGAAAGEGSAPAGGERLLIAPSGLIAVRNSTDTSSLPEREVYLAIEFIRAHLGESLSVEQVARQVMVSRRWLERHFKQALGHSPQTQIRMMRLDHARKLLLETGWSTEKIAQASGMGNAQSLNRVFQSELKMTPGGFRTRHRLGEE